MNNGPSSSSSDPGSVEIYTNLEKIMHYGNACSCISEFSAGMGHTNFELMQQHYADYELQKGSYSNSSWDYQYKQGLAMGYYSYCLYLYGFPDEGYQIYQVLMQHIAILREHAEKNINQLESLLRKIDQIKVLFMGSSFGDSVVINALSYFETKFFTDLTAENNEQSESDDNLTTVLEQHFANATKFTTASDGSRVNSNNANLICSSLSFLLKLAEQKEEAKLKTLPQMNKILFKWLEYFKESSSLSEKIVYEKIHRIAFKVLNYIKSKSAQPNASVSERPYQVNLTRAQQLKLNKEENKILKLLARIKDIDLSLDNPIYTSVQKSSKIWFVENASMSLMLRRKVNDILEKNTLPRRETFDQSSSEGIREAKHYWQVFMCNITLRRFLLDQSNSNDYGYVAVVTLFYNAMSLNFNALASMFDKDMYLSEKEPYFFTVLKQLKALLERYKPQFDLIFQCAALVDPNSSVCYEKILTNLKQNMFGFKARDISIEADFGCVLNMHGNIQGAFEANDRAFEEFKKLGDLKKSASKEDEAAISNEISYIFQKLYEYNQTYLRGLEFIELQLDADLSDISINESPKIDKVISKYENILQWEGFRIKLFDTCRDWWRTNHLEFDEQDHAKLHNVALLLTKLHRRYSFLQAQDRYHIAEFLLGLLVQQFGFYEQKKQTEIIKYIDYLAEKVVPNIEKILLNQTFKYSDDFILDIKQLAGQTFLDLIDFEIKCAESFLNTHAAFAKERLNRAKELLAKFSLYKRKIIKHHRDQSYSLTDIENKLTLELEALSQQFSKPVEQPPSVALQPNLLTDDPVAEIIEVPLKAVSPPVSKKSKREKRKQRREYRERQKNKGKHIQPLQSIPVASSSNEEESDNLVSELETSMSALSITPEIDYSIHQLNDVELLNVPVYVIDILKCLRAQPGVWAFVVGGYVRDYLLDPKSAKSNDIDIVTNCRPEWIENILAPYNPVNSKNIDCLFNIYALCKIEVFCSQYSTLEEDAINRDFTINTFYADERGIYDPLKHYPDLSLPHLKMIGDTKTRLEEDPKRWFRYVRLCQQTKKSIDPVDLDILRNFGLSQFQKLPLGAIFVQLKDLFLGAQGLNNLRFMIENNLLANLMTSNLRVRYYYPKQREAYWLKKLDSIYHFPSNRPEIDIIAAFLVSEVFVRSSEELGSNPTKIITDVIQRFASELSPDNVKSMEFHTIRGALYSHLYFNFYELAEFNRARMDAACKERAAKLQSQARGTPRRGGRGNAITFRYKSSTGSSNAPIEASTSDSRSNNHPETGVRRRGRGRR